MYRAPRLGARGRLSAPAAPVRPPFCRLAAALAPTRRMRPARPCHWQRAPRDRGGCSGEHKWPQVSTRRGGSTYILATARPAQITAVCQIVELHAGAHGRARPGRTTAALRPLCARQPPNGRRAGATRQSGGAVGEGSNIFAEGGHLRPRFLIGVRHVRGGLRTLHFGWCARRSVGRLRPCHWQRAPRDRERSLGEHKWPQVSTRQACQTYILATVRPAQITAVWNSTPAPTAARGPGEPRPR